LLAPPNAKVDDGAAGADPNPAPEDVSDPNSEADGAAGLTLATDVGAAAPKANGVCVCVGAAKVPNDGGVDDVVAVAVG